jgi:hypothetical protein
MVRNGERYVRDRVLVLSFLAEDHLIDWLLVASFWH